MRVTSEDILHGPIRETLVRMTGPMIIGIFAMMLFGAVDTFFISLMGTDELAAISFTFPVTFTIMNLSIGMGIATSVTLAQIIGRGEKQTAQRVCTDALWFSTVLVVLVALLGLVTIDPLFRALGATDNTLPFIREYMVIWYLAVGLLVIPMTGNAAIRATGDTKWPSILMMASGLVNAILDPFLIFGIGPFPEMGVTGAALATAISWAIGFIVALWLLGVRENLLTIALPTLAEVKSTWGQLLRIGSPISLANMLTPITILFLTALVARFGEAAVAGYGAGGRLEAFAMVVAFAMTSTLSPFMAQNIGAGNVGRAREALNMSLKFIFVFQLVAYMLLAIAAPWITSVFSKDPAVLLVANQYLWIMPAGACFYALVIVMATAFNAAKESNKTLLSSLVRLFVFILPCAFLGGYLMDIPGLFLGSVVGNLMAAVFAFWLVTKMLDRLEAKTL
ncbi:MAG: MATE family efflux transporter [Porticoccaceae bacterium]|nr:MATE family efflux transporter [Porticoccaceae bacterium]